MNLLYNKGKHRLRVVPQMEIMLSITGVVIVLLFLLITKFDEAKNWVTIYEAQGREIEKAHARLAYLKRHGVKCRIRIQTPLGARGSGPLLVTTAKVDVCRQEWKRAAALLAECKGD